MAAIIDFKHVNKYYGKFHALKDINLSIEEGQVVTPDIGGHASTTEFTQAIIEKL